MICDTLLVCLFLQIVTYHLYLLSGVAAKDPFGIYRKASAQHKRAL